MDVKQLYKIQVRGLVQGVGFRWSAAREADKLGIKGFVRNQQDGSVFIEAEGDPDKLKMFVAWCKKGPGFGFVESVVTESAPAVNYREFRIEK